MIKFLYVVLASYTSYKLIKIDEHVVIAGTGLAYLVLIISIPIFPKDLVNRFTDLDMATLSEGEMTGTVLMYM